MHIEVRVDPSGDSARDSGHRHLFLSLGVGDTAPARRWTGQRWACAAGSYEVTPSDRLVSGECPSQADESTSGQSVRTSAGLIESDLARAFTHTLTRSRFEMVDRQRVTSILAAGSEHHPSALLRTANRRLELSGVPTVAPRCRGRWRLVWKPETPPCRASVERHRSRQRRLVRALLKVELAEDGPCLTAGSTRSSPAQPDSSDGGQGLSTVTHGQPARRRRRSEGSVVNTTASWTSAAWAATMASMPLGVRRAPDRSTPNRSWPARRAVA